MEQAASIHPFYPVFRGLALAVLVPVTLLYLHQIFVDRKELAVLSNWTKAHLVFRVGGWIGSLVYIAVQVDFYGVFGIYDPFVSSMLHSVVLNALTIPMYYAWYISAVSSSAMLSREQQKRVKRGALATFVMVGPFNTGLAVVSAITQNTITRAINVLIVIPSLVVLAAGCTYLYMLLRRLIKEIESTEGRPVKIQETIKAPAL